MNDKHYSYSSYKSTEGDQVYQSKLGKIMIFNRVLNDEEIANLSQEGYVFKGEIRKKSLFKRIWVKIFGRKK